MLLFLKSIWPKTLLYYLKAICDRLKEE